MCFVQLCAARAQFVVLLCAMIDFPFFEFLCLGFWSNFCLFWIFAKTKERHKQKGKRDGEKNEERRERPGAAARLLLLFPLRSFSSVHFFFIFFFSLLFSRAGEKEGRNARAKRTEPLVAVVRSFLLLDIIVVGRRSKSRRGRCPRRGAAAREFILARAELVGERVSQR